MLMAMVVRRYVELESQGKYGWEKVSPGRTSIPLTELKIERLEKQFLKVKIWHTDSKDYSKGNIVSWEEKE